MTWMSQLCLTYDNYFNSEEDNGLLPLDFIKKAIDLDVIITDKGEFKGAKKYEKAKGVEYELSMIPTTQKSQSRTSAIIPYPLTDKLMYIAGDFEKYCTDSKAKEAHSKYISQLEKWRESDYCHPKVEAIYKYLTKNTLMADLVETGIVTLDDRKLLNNGNKHKEKDWWVRFLVLSKSDSTMKATGEDPDLMRAYQNFYLSRTEDEEEDKDVCYCSGEREVIASTQPYAIGKLKLISSNDNNNFTFRGRFNNAEQAYALGYSSSQKIHIALGWLLEKYSIKIGNKYFICWSPELNIEGTATLNNIYQTELNDYRKDVINNEAASHYLESAITKGRNEFTTTDNINVIILDSPTDGRMSITYFREFLAGDFFDRLSYWNETCTWWYRKGSDYLCFVPTFNEIVSFAFGHEIKNAQTSQIEINNQLRNEQLQRVMSFALDGRRITQDIVMALVNKASRLLSYSYRTREKILSITCAVIAKNYFDQGIYKKGDLNIMNLNLENSDRSYLFGRLLAVFEKVERSTYKWDDNIDREPNALRLQSSYVMHPLTTWKTIEGQLIPYYRKLTPQSRMYYKALISDIVGKFENEDLQVLNQPLGESYLLGYYLQRAKLYEKGNPENKDNEVKEAQEDID